jgi:hypothetical protein
MDKFTKGMFIASIIGAIGVTIWRDAVDAAKQQKLDDEQQFKISTEAAEVDPECWCYGGVFAHLELEKQYVAWRTSTDDYIAQQLYTGDHWSDPRILVVTEYSTGQVVQVAMLKSYQSQKAIAEEVPD